MIIMIGGSNNNKLSALILESSIRRRASIPLYFHRTLEKSNIDKDKFLCPYFWDFKGPALYLSPQLFFLIDIKELFECFSSQHTIQVVRSYRAKGLKHPIILFNSQKCRSLLSYSFVNSASSDTLEELEFLSDTEIGYLPDGLISDDGIDNVQQTPKIYSYKNNPAPLDETHFASRWNEEYNHVIQSFV